MPFAFYDRDSSCWRTFQVSLTGECTPFSEGFPKSGMMRDGKLYPLPRSVRFTAATVSGLWATPSAADAKGSHGGGQGRSLRTDMHTMIRTGAVPANVERWPTPSVTDARDMPARKAVKVGKLGPTPRAAHALSLMVAVKLFPTRAASNIRQAGISVETADKEIRRGQQVTLPVAVKSRLWPTPQALMHKQDVADDGTYARRIKASKHQKMLPVAVKVADDPPPSSADPTQLLMFDLPDDAAAASDLRLLPTPCARDHRDTGDPMALARAAEKHQETLARAVAAGRIQNGDTAPTGSLNPQWVEWLMGYPSGWLHLKPSGMPSSRKSRTPGHTNKSSSSSRKVTKQKPSSRTRASKRKAARKK